MDSQFLTDSNLFLEKNNKIILFKGFTLNELLLHKKRKITKKMTTRYNLYFQKYSLSRYSGKFKLSIEFKTTNLYYNNQLIYQYTNEYFIGSSYYYEFAIKCILAFMKNESSIESICFDHKRKINDFITELKEYFKTIVADKEYSLRWIKKNCIVF